MFAWLRRLHAAPAIPEAAWQTTMAHYPFLDVLPAGDQQHLRDLAARFLKHKEFHGAHGFIITDEVALAIAAQAVLPILHLPGELDWYDDFVGIVVHPAEALARRQSMDEDNIVHEYSEIITGEAMAHGPMMLSWPDVLAGGDSADTGYNVVIHEFAHKIDLRDGAADGCPPLPRGFAGTRNPGAARNAWFAVMEPAYEAFREQSIIAERFNGPPTWLDPYGAESISEFFAVACEGYFVNRLRFAQEQAALLPLFDEFFSPQLHRLPAIR